MNKLTVFFDHIRNACIQTGLPIEEIAQKITSVGISGTEIEYVELLGSEGKKLATTLSELGLPISCVYCHFHWEDPANTLSSVEVLSRLKELGIHNLLAIPGFILPEQSASQSRENLAKPLTELCELAIDYDIQVLMEDFDSTLSSFGDSQGVLWYLNKIPNLGCAYDTGNFLFFGEDSLEILPSFLTRIKYVHCKDRSLTPVTGETPLKTVTNQLLYSSPVGSGDIHMTDILREILSDGYKGPLAIEHFGSLNQLDYMLSSAIYLNKVIEEVNV